MEYTHIVILYDIYTSDSYLVIMGSGPSKEYLTVNEVCSY